MRERFDGLDEMGHGSRKHTYYELRLKHKIDIERALTFGLKPVSELDDRDSKETNDPE